MLTQPFHRPKQGKPKFSPAQSEKKLLPDGEAYVEFGTEIPGKIRFVTRALRRHHERRMKARARRYLRRCGMPSISGDPRVVGIIASTHCRPCSCFLCQPGKEIPPQPERAFLASSNGT